MVARYLVAMEALPPSNPLPPYSPLCYLLVQQTFLQERCNDGEESWISCGNSKGW